MSQFFINNAAAESAYIPSPPLPTCTLPPLLPIVPVTASILPALQNGQIVRSIVDANHAVHIGRGSMHWLNHATINNTILYEVPYNTLLMNKSHQCQC